MTLITSLSVWLGVGGDAITSAKLSWLIGRHNPPSPQSFKSLAIKAPGGRVVTLTTNSPPRATLKIASRCLCHVWAIDSASLNRQNVMTAGPEGSDNHRCHRSAGGDGGNDCQRWEIKSTGKHLFIFHLGSFLLFTERDPDQSGLIKPGSTSWCHDVMLLMLKSRFIDRKDKQELSSGGRNAFYSSNHLLLCQLNENKLKRKL